MAGNSFSCEFDFNNNLHHAVLWENGSIIDLNALIPADSTLQVAAAWNINDRGEIDGIGVPPGVDPHKAFTEGHAFLLIPCDEHHLGVEACDYSLVEESATTGVSSAPATPTPTSANQIGALIDRTGFTTRPEGHGGARPSGASAPRLRDALADNLVDNPNRPVSRTRFTRTRPRSHTQLLGGLFFFALGGLQRAIP